MDFANTLKATACSAADNFEVGAVGVEVEAFEDALGATGWLVLCDPTWNLRVVAVGVWAVAFADVHEFEMHGLSLLKMVLDDLELPTLIVQAVPFVDRLSATSGSFLDYARDLTFVMAVRISAVQVVAFVNNLDGQVVAFVDNLDDFLLHLGLHQGDLCRSQSLVQSPARKILAPEPRRTTTTATQMAESQDNASALATEISQWLGQQWLGQSLAYRGALDHRVHIDIFLHPRRIQPSRRGTTLF